MFKCLIGVFIPLCAAGTQERLSFTVARYDFDPGLQPGDEVRINNAPFVRTRRNGQPVEGDDPKFSFWAQVLKRRKIVEPGAGGDKFFLLIDVEIADKELLPEIVSYFKETFPGGYEDYRPPIEPVEFPEEE